MSLKHNIRKFINATKQAGVKDTVVKAQRRLLTMIGFDRFLYKENKQINTIYEEIAQLHKNSKIKGVKIITSALEFEEVYNQRTINLAKYVAEDGYAVLYVVWQWDLYEKLEKGYQKVYQNIYEIPMYDFVYGIEKLEALQSIQDKTFISTFPAKIFYNCLETLKRQNYISVYDNMDEWEEFYKVGHAPWYKKEIEEQFIKDSDFVYAVSEPLKQKFSYIRNDIYVIGNGYQVSLSGKKNVALKSEATDSRIHIGYFGHLTDSWFDYDLIFELAKNDRIFIHLIGHGVPDHILERINSLPNMKFYGKVHPSELHEYVSKWHIGMIPFQSSKLSEAVDPIKIYEYLFFGLPTVSTGIPHIGKYPMVYHCNDTNEVKDSINKLYNDIINATIQYDLLNDFLTEVTWDKRFEKMEEIQSSKTQ